MSERQDGWMENKKNFFIFLFKFFIFKFSVMVNENILLLVYYITERFVNVERAVAAKKKLLLLLSNSNAYGTFVKSEKFIAI